MASYGSVTLSKGEAREFKVNGEEQDIGENGKREFSFPVSFGTTTTPSPSSDDPPVPSTLPPSPPSSHHPSPAPGSLWGVDENPTKMKTFSVLSNLAWPVIITFVLELLPALVNSIAVGRLGEVELASVSLASMFCNVTGISVGFGIATAMDTLCSQNFGANNQKAVVIIVQRALLIEFAVFFPISLIWYFSGDLLLFLGQDEAVSNLSGLYCQVMIVGLYPLLAYEVLKKYLQSQGIVVPQMMIAILANVWNVLANWLFIYHFDTGFVGGPLARSSTHWVLLFFTIVYMLVTKRHDGIFSPSTWSSECLHGWGHFMSLGVPGMLMMCLEWWAFEVLSIFAGILGTTELAAQSVIYNIVMLIFFVPFGTSVAASILIGNSLGKGWKKPPEKISQVSFTLVVIAEVILGIVLVGLRNYIPLIFTTEQEVIDLVAFLMPVVALYQLFDGIAFVAGGVLRGCGKQLTGAWLNLVGYFLLGLSLSAALCFLTPLGLLGIWIGFGAAVLIASLLSLVIVFRIDWDFQVELARERVSLLTV